ncbi:glycosyltransferase [Lactobacillus delbrueckii subsp. bulgaricus]|nr:glycosyltransferase [Lactobacillus delbrueckii subsp. bulgaricus]
MNSNNLTMYMVTHKPVDFIPEGRTPIFVGNGDNIRDYLRDNTGDNISEKNPYYCELTAMYWIWKNDSSSKYISIEHYRRFFMDPNALVPKVCPKEKIEGYLEKGKIVLPSITKWHMSVGDIYRESHVGKDLDNVANIIAKEQPEYVADFNQVMSGRDQHELNMMVLPKAIFDEYCEWLFNILFKLEKETDLSDRSKYQQRMYGFMSERLEDVWLKHNEYNSEVRELPIYFVLDTKLKSILKSEKKRFG